jgi:hypothetical protein
MEQKFLRYANTAMPMRISGVTIFIGLLIIYFVFPNVPIILPGIGFAFMVIAILFSADVTVVANKEDHTFGIIKKRIFASSSTQYDLEDIMFIARNTEFVRDGQGKESERVSYSLAVKGKTGVMYNRGYIPIPLPIPTNGILMFSQFVRDAQALTRAHELATFIGVPFYENGGPNDMLVNTVEEIKSVAKAVGNMPDDIFAQIKEANDKAAREIMESKQNEGVPPQN